MAQRVNIELIDDLDGKSKADQTVAFALDGTGYEIDLADKNAAKLREALAPYIGKARRTGRTTAKGAKAKGPDPAAIRAWAKENGYDVPDRGRIPANVKDAYAAANAA